MKRIELFLVICGVFIAAAEVRAETQTIPLPELLGVYSTGALGPSRRTSLIDATAQFERIDEIRLRFAGTIAPALLRGTGPSGEGDPIDSEVYPYLNITLGDSGGPAEWYGALLEDGAFVAEIKFAMDLSPLAQSNSEVELLLGPIGTTGFSKQVVPAVLGISDASLLISGTPIQISVPEPVHLSTLLIAILAARRRKAR